MKRFSSCCIVLFLSTVSKNYCSFLKRQHILGGRGFLAGACVAAAQQENPVGGSETAGGVHLDPQVILSVLTEVQLWREQHEDLFLFGRYVSLE